jgi:predicted transcriptional regulator YdeE
MEQIKTRMIYLIGIKLRNKTTNEQGQSGIDCGNLWQEFEQQHISDSIPNKISSAIYAFYYNYESDHNGSFSYFIGCRVEDGTEAPGGLSGLIIPEGHYVKLLAKGIMPACVSDTWKKIWASDMKRSYAYDFEVYDDRSSDWTNAEVDIFVGHDSNEVPKPLNGNQVLVFQRSLD